MLSEQSIAFMTESYAAYNTRDSRIDLIRRYSKTLEYTWVNGHIHFPRSYDETMRRKLIREAAYRFQSSTLGD